MENKEHYRRKLQKQLDEWKVDLEKLRGKAEAAGGEARKNLLEQVKVLESKIEEGTGRVKELAEMNEESWEALKEGFEKAWKALSEGFRDAKEKFQWKKEEDE